MFDPNQHVIDPKTGFAVDKDTGHVMGLTQAPVTPPNEADIQFPKWVKPHTTHVVKKPFEDGSGVHVSTPAFASHFVDRISGKVTVLVEDAKDEARALAAYEVPKNAADSSG